MTEHVLNTYHFDKQETPANYNIEQTIAFTQGAVARQLGFAMDHCPWKAGTALGEAWRAGWETDTNKEEQCHSATS